MKPDYDFVEEYVVRKAEQRYGTDFDNLSEEIQEQLREEAVENYENEKICEAEAQIDHEKYDNDYNGELQEKFSN